MKKRNVLALAIIGCLGTQVAQADVPEARYYEIWECTGSATFEGGYTVDVTVDSPYAGIWYQVEDDDDGDCQNFKDEDPDFACNKSGNLVTSRINDDTDPLEPLDYHQSNSGASLILSDSEVANDSTYAMVHANVFMPGDCALDFQCDDDNDGETANINCYDSGFGGGPLFGGFYANALDSCEEAFDETSEGFFAELNAEGGMISPDRNPKKKNDGPPKNWAMYVGLTAGACDQTIEVETDAYGYHDHQATEAPPPCDADSVVVDGIVDGGDYAVDGGTDAGDVTFTPTTNCTASWVSDECDSDGEGCYYY
jgi:hypothetical protein